MWIHMPECISYISHVYSAYKTFCIRLSLSDIN